METGVLVLLMERGDKRTFVPSLAIVYHFPNIGAIALDAYASISSFFFSFFIIIIT